ncbi:hypothetical protein GW916_12220 [bacterium]|nr:hypothetical protein [bacterium]
MSVENDFTKLSLRVGLWGQINYFGRMPFVLYLVGLISLGCWRFAPALLEPGRTLAALDTDATGTTGWIAEVSRQFQEQGWSVFSHGDLILNSNIGIGLMEPAPSLNPLWRSLYILLGEFVPLVDDRYDWSIVLQFLLTGLIAWPFARSVGLRPVWAGVFSFFVLTAENTHRVHVHNGLSYLWVPMLGLWASLYFARHPNFKRAGLLAFVWWIAFLGNEYFGYFLLYASPALIVGYNWQDFKKQKWAQLLRYLKLILPWAPMVIALVCFSHPAVTLWRVIPPEHLPEYTSRPLPARTTQPKHVADAYSIKNIMAWIEPGLWEVPAWLKDGVFRSHVYEFSFRIGMVLFVFFLVIWYFRKHRILDWKDPNAPPLRPWLTMAGVMALMGLSTQYVLSGVWITMLIAPVFRVSVRAHAFTLIGVLIVFFLIVQWIYARYHKPQLRLGLVLLCVLVLFDITWPRSVVLSPYKTHPIPPLSSLMYELRDHHEEIGSPPSATLYLVCEKDPCTYRYPSYVYAGIHKLPVLDELAERKDLASVQQFFKNNGEASAATIQLFKSLGLRYILIPRLSGEFQSWIDYAQDSAELSTLASNEQGVVLELQNAAEFVRADFLKYLDIDQL